MTNVLFQIAPVSQVNALVNLYSSFPRFAADAFKIKSGLDPGTGFINTTTESSARQLLGELYWT